MNKYHVFYVTALVLCLVQIWLPQYYVTGDGPTHLYNASMLKSSWLGEHQEFYNNFYIKNVDVNPNWFGHIVLAILVLFSSAAVAEKIFISFYVIVFLEGFRRLDFTKENHIKHLVVVGFLLVFNHTLAKGFYNFNMSIALALWMIWATIKCLKKGTIANYILLFFISGTTFITHPLGFLYGVLVSMLLTVSFSIFSTDSKALKSKLLFLAKKAFWLGVCIIPFVLLIWYYRTKFTDIPIYAFHKERLDTLLEFRDFTTYTSKEDLWARFMGYTLIYTYIILSIVSMVNGKMQKQYAGILLLPIVLLLLHLFIPDNMAGGGLMAIRTRQLFFLSLGVSTVYLLSPYKGVVFFFNAWSFIIFAGISLARLPVLQNVGRAAYEYLSVTKDVKPEFVLLPLSFSHNGKNMDGSYISDCNWLFQHVADYAATDKPLIVLDNYEANTGYFPFIWKEQTNPYRHLTTAAGDIESQPPAADIAAYEKASGHDVDYIVTWCYDSSYRSTSHVNELMSFIEGNYVIAKASKQGRAVLYKNKHIQ